MVRAVWKLAAAAALLTPFVASGHHSFAVFFDPSKNNQCSEPQAEYVRDKLKANFCDFFEPNARVPLTSRGGAQAVNRDDVRKAFDKLFKK